MEPIFWTGQRTTDNYPVVVSSPRSVRLPDDVLHRLSSVASRRGISVASGRRAGLIAGSDVDEVIRTLRDHQTDGGVAGEDDVVEVVAESLSLSADGVRAAVAYYADHRDEIDARISADQGAADELEAAWRRQQEILAGNMA